MIAPNASDLAALEVHGAVSRETQDRLEAIVNTLNQWQKKTNLIAPNTLEHIWTRHILDSAQLVSLRPNAEKWVDLGSGGGFPGLVIAAFLADQEGFSISLVESNHKKTAFLRQAAQIAGMSSVVNVVSERIENALPHLQTPDVITARALAPLKQLLNWTHGHLSPDKKAIGLFQKGRDYGLEIADCADNWRFDLVEHYSGIETDSRILEICHVQAIGLIAQQ